MNKLYSFHFNRNNFVGLHSWLVTTYIHYLNVLLSMHNYLYVMYLVQSNDPSCTSSYCNIASICTLLTNTTLGAPIDRLGTYNFILYLITVINKYINIVLLHYVTLYNITLSCIVCNSIIRQLCDCRLSRHAGPRQ